MDHQRRSARPLKKWWPGGRRLRYLLVFLVAEKIVQHTVVTLAFFWNAFDIRSTVVVDYRFLMISGAVVAVLFAVALKGVLRSNVWALRLVAALAAFDVVGEFVAQGTVFITITVSFLVAIALLALSLYQRSALRPLRQGA